MSLSNNPIDELTERPNDKFGRFLYDLAYILAILGGVTVSYTHLTLPTKA